MGRLCSVCVHGARTDLELMLIQRVPYRNIAQQFQVSPAALSRHTRDQLPERLRHAQAAEEVEQALVVTAELAKMYSATTDILTRAQEAEDDDLALRALDRLHRQLQLKLGVLDQAAFEKRLRELEAALEGGVDQW